MTVAPVLVTAFGPFPGVEANPTERVLELVRARWSGPRPLVGEVLEVAFETVPGRVRSLIDEHRPAAVVCLGVNAGSTRMGLEATAVNEFGPNASDARGKTAAGPVVPGGPARWSSPFRVDRAVATLKAAGLPIERSDDAGRYLCNAALAVACDAVLPGADAVFLHIPPVEALDPEIAARATLALASTESWWANAG